MSPSHKTEIYSHENFADTKVVSEGRCSNASHNETAFLAQAYVLVEVSQNYDLASLSLVTLRPTCKRMNRSVPSFDFI